MDAAVVGPLPALANPPWLDAALRLAKRDAEAFVPELHATLTDTVLCVPASVTLRSLRVAGADARSPHSRKAPDGLPHRSSPGATLNDVSAAVSQRAAQWAETRAPFARWTAAHYARPLGVAIDAPQLGEALEPLYEEY